MPTEPHTPPSARRRLGEWLTREEEHVAAFREKIAADARAHAGEQLRTPVVPVNASVAIAR